MWTLCGHCELLGQVLYLRVELSVQRRLYPIFVSGVGLSDILRVFRRLTGCQRGPSVLGRHTFNFVKIRLSNLDKIQFTFQLNGIKD